MTKQVIFTADDLGIDVAVNRGILESFRNGVLTSTSLLMNAPDTEEGIGLAVRNPDLETGLHLSMVEGISLRGKESTLTDPVRYFEGRICLLRDWKVFLKKYLSGKLNFDELREELELQILEFKKHFVSVPFLNGTQHMHLLPRVWKIVFELCRKYHIEAVRLPKIQPPSVFWMNRRFPYLLPFQYLGQQARKDMKRAGMKYPDDVLGMPYSGRISEKRLLFLLKHVPKGKTEIVMHPGYESKVLRNNLPWAYSDFNWDRERSALTSPMIREYLEKHAIERISYRNL